MEVVHFRQESRWDSLANRARLGKITLTPIVPRPFFHKKIFKSAISISKSKTILKLFFFISNRRILHYTSLRMCGRKFENFDCIDCKIFAFKVMKTRCFVHCSTRFFWL